MLKKYVFYFIVSFLSCNTLMANENLSLINSSQEDFVELSLPLRGKIKKSNITKIQESYNQAFDDDQRIKLYLQTPYEKRQYVFPMIHAAPFISHKIKTHPEIIIWKNKKPTIIAPQLVEFSKNHLENLSPFFYIYLDPDFWNPPHPESQQVMAFNNPFSIMNEEEATQVYPTLQKIFNLSDKPTDNYLKTILNEEDILNVSNVISDLDSFLSTLKDSKKFTLDMIDLQRTQIHRAIADPFKMFIYSIKKTGEEKNFSDFLKKHNFSSLDEFAKKADLIFKSFQILHLNLNAAIEINHNRFNNNFKELSESDFATEDITPIEMYSRLHQAKSGDVYFVKKYLPQLKNIFKTKFIESGIMIFVD